MAVPRHRMHLTTPMPRDRALATIVSIGTAICTPADAVPEVRRERWHSWQFMLAVRGEGEVEVDGRVLPIPQHAAVFLPRDRAHQYTRVTTCPHWEYRWIECDGEQFPTLLAMLGLGDAWSIPECADILPLIDELHRLLLTRGDAALHEAGMLFFHALAKVAQRAPQQLASAPTPVERTIAWMERHLGETITLADLAAIAGVSSWHCVRLFRALHGVPPITYLRLLRLHRAKTLLQSSDLGVRQIGRAVGYAKVQHFTRMFTQAMGMSPRAFRAGNSHFHAMGAPDPSTPARR